MSYLTLTNANLTEAQASDLNAYTAAQITSGNTDGIRVNVTRNGVVDSDNQPVLLIQRNWADNASASAYIAYVNTLDGTVNYAEIVAPL
jgi:hypothetical protein